MYIPALLALGGLLVATTITPLNRIQDEPQPKEYGHSSHGAAFDVGPRQRPWKIEGIGSAPFAITTSVPEVQEWFDQGNALLHSFWYYEAERAFRWCIDLDPDCAMAYWALSRCMPYDRERADALLAEAIERKHLVSEREQRWIEAWEEAFVANLDRIQPARRGWNATSPVLARALEKILIDDPDDIEAKVYYVLNSLFRDGQYSPERYALDAVLQQVFEIAPRHPGAVHYRIHNWDTIELGHFALDSCAAYGRIAHGIGHANHMPGHIYTKLGMWHEGAIWLDSATRVEKAYMAERLIFPFNAWNYAHNRNFLASAQSQLGLPSAALQGARDLLNAPLDPDMNQDEGGYSCFRQGLDALRRTLVRFECWEEILREDSIPWRNTLQDDVWRTYCEALAHIGLGNLEDAERLALELRGYEDEINPTKLKASAGDRQAARDIGRLLGLHPLMWREVEARLRLARGETVKGLSLLQEVAELEHESRPENNDPPNYPRSLYNVLGEAYLDHDAPQLAVGAFERTLEVVQHNGFSLSGLARAHHAQGDIEAATAAYARMLAVWSHAEPGIWQNERARALGIEAEPLDFSPGPQRNYATETLATLGPNTWQPYAAPELDAVDATGNHITLADYRGKNILLVYYLSDQCVHCVEQLRLIEERAGEFAERDTVLLAVSADPPERNATGRLANLPFLLLSDSADHANAIRWRSYDEFEDLELHSTNLIDRRGRLRWARTGGDPFEDLDFLLGEIDRIEEIESSSRLEPLGMIVDGNGR